MTRGDFIKAYGAEFKKLTGKPIFAALLETIDDAGPIKKLAAVPANDRLHGATVFLNEIAGWELLRAFIVGLSASPDEQFEPEDKFGQPEAI